MEKKKKKRTCEVLFFWSNWLKRFADDTPTGVSFPAGSRFILQSVSCSPSTNREYRAAIERTTLDAHTRLDI